MYHYLTNVLVLIRRTQKYTNTYSYYLTNVLFLIRSKQFERTNQKYTYHYLTNVLYLVRSKQFETVEENNSCSATKKCCVLQEQ